VVEDAVDCTKTVTRNVCFSQDVNYLSGLLASVVAVTSSEVVV